MDNYLEIFKKNLLLFKNVNLEEIAKLKNGEFYKNLSNENKEKIDKLFNSSVITEELTEDQISLFLMDLITKLVKEEKYTGGFFDCKKLSKLIPTIEDIELSEIKYEEFLSKNFISGSDNLYFVSKLQDAVSNFISDNDPYKFLLFNETFDVSTILEWEDIEYIYNQILNNPLIVRKQEIYNKHKDYVSNISTDINKYLIANILESVDIAIYLYETINNISIDKTYLDNVLIPIANELHQEFDAYDFINKYSIGVINFKNGNIDIKFSDQFIEQYCRPYRIKKQFKLF